MLPTVQFLAGRGEMTCVRAIVKGNLLKAEVVLYALRAHELPADWFTRIGNPVLAQIGPQSTDSFETQTVNEEVTARRPVNSETPPPPLPPAGWYADPHHLARLRYWDGTQWTDHTAP
jgi:hypothetical protein